MLHRKEDFITVLLTRGCSWGHLNYFLDYCRALELDEPNRLDSEEADVSLDSLSSSLSRNSSDTLPLSYSF